MIYLQLFGTCYHINSLFRLYNNFEIIGQYYKYDLTFLLLVNEVCSSSLICIHQFVVVTLCVQYAASRVDLVRSAIRFH